jgi:hypothetical protein
MNNSPPTPTANFHWRAAYIRLARVAEKFGPIDIQNDTAETVRLALGEIDRTLFPAGIINRAIVEKIGEAKKQEWLTTILRAAAFGIFEFEPQPNCDAQTLLIDSESSVRLFEEYRRKKETRDEEARSKNQPKFEAVWNAVRGHGISGLLVEFSGSGDEGEIDSIELWPAERENSTAAEPGDDTDAAFLSKMVAVDGETAPVELEGLVRQLSNHVLDRAEIPDWYNNEGGFGRIEWSAGADGENTLVVTVNQRVDAFDTTVITYDVIGRMVDKKYQGKTS